ALAVAVLALASQVARAQLDPLRPPGLPQRQSNPNTKAPPSTPPPPAPTSPVIARVDGRPLTQQDYDRVAIPYFARLQQQFGAEFNEDIRNFAKKSVLDELFR